MKRYSQLTINEKINFKSYCAYQRFTMYGMEGFTPFWFAMTVNAIYGDFKLHPLQFNKTYPSNFK